MIKDSKINICKKNYCLKIHNMNQKMKTIEE